MMRRFLGVLKRSWLNSRNVFEMRYSCNISPGYHLYDDTNGCMLKVARNRTSESNCSAQRQGESQRLRGSSGLGFTDRHFPATK
jgi:hypothetical protein